MRAFCLGLLAFFTCYHVQAQEIVPAEYPLYSIEPGSQSLLPGTYLVMSPLEIGQNDTLSLKAGTRLGFVPGTGLKVKGTLVVEGSQEKPVLFTLAGDPTETRWEGIQLEEGGSISGQYWYSYYADVFLQGDLSRLKLESSVWAFHRTALKWQDVERPATLISQNLLAFNEVAIRFEDSLPERVFAGNLFCQNDLPLRAGRLVPDFRFMGQCWCAEDEDRLASQGIPPRATRPVAQLQDCPDIDHPLLRGGGGVTIVIDDDLGVTPNDPRLLKGVRTAGTLVEDAYWVDNQGDVLEYCLYNINGQSLLRGQIPAGTRMDFSWGRLAPGWFVLHLRRDNQQLVKRLIRTP